MLKAIKKIRIHEEAVRQIRELINQGKLKAGDQLPSERELAETFKVSRTSVREALRALESKDLIVTRTGMGTFIADQPAESLVTSLASLMTEAKDGLADIFEMRKLIEPQIAGLAAERANEEDIRGLGRILETQREQIARGATGVEADTEFHFSIGKATQNQALQRLISGLMDLLSDSREESLQPAGRNEASLASHQHILAAIEKHDQEAARAAMFHHIDQVERNILPEEEPSEASLKLVSASS